MYRALILCSRLQETIDLYRDLFASHQVAIDVPSLNGKQQFDETDLLAVIDQYDGVIAGDDEFTKAVLEKGVANQLKVVSKWGIGVDAIDLESAANLGIPVYNTPGAFPDEVADVATGYILMLARQLHKLDQAVRSGVWMRHSGISLRGKTLGVIGVGSIGRAIVERGQALGMNTVGFDIAELKDIEQVSLDKLCNRSDFIALACNLTPDNHHLISTNQFEQMKDGVYIINVARGPLIDESALISYLRSGKIAGAALDVFEVEPLPDDSPLREFDNCIFGTHNGSNTEDAVLRVNVMSIKNLFKGLGIEYQGD